jgi:hypothetical protein
MLYEKRDQKHLYISPSEQRRMYRDPGEKSE